MATTLTRNGARQQTTIEPRSFEVEAQRSGTSRFADDDQSGLSRLFKQYNTMVADPDNWDEECLRPTAHAYNSVFMILLQSEYIGFAVPKGDMIPDGDGGIRVDFREETGASLRYVRLGIHASNPQQNFIYWQEGSAPGHLKAAPSPYDLGRRFTWLSHRVPVSSWLG